MGKWRWMAIEMVSFPIENGDLNHSYVKFPEGIPGSVEGDFQFSPWKRWWFVLGIASEIPLASGIDLVIFLWFSGSTLWSTNSLLWTIEMENYKW